MPAEQNDDDHDLLTNAEALARLDAVLTQERAVHPRSEAVQARLDRLQQAASRLRLEDQPGLAAYLDYHPATTAQPVRDPLRKD
jgi:hypothetical protein